VTRPVHGPCRLALLGALLVSGGCGDSQPHAPEPAGDAVAADPGATALLARLAQRVAAGQALTDEAWGQDVDFLRRLLWPDVEAAEAADASLTHAAASHVAGDVGRELAGGPTAREALAQRDPASLAVHDGWRVAAEAGPEAYRTWCEGPGRALMVALRASRESLFERPGASAPR
jgi:hypothetical protein